VKDRQGRTEGQRFIDRCQAQARMRQHRKGGSSVADRARDGAIRVLIERHRREFDLLRLSAKNHLLDQETRARLLEQESV
jgi:hypothetical protein